ncbi:hypothetical protein ACWD6L_02375 [Micromonospora profundi]|uniref:hypothetical protein n=1 Tax=Micromonospora sp. NRRL B-16802 TaxID=1415541 RepID=UPI000B1C011D|nr:hypothetical protein [Micromonospora sp. NRRL B-16802]
MRADARFLDPIGCEGVTGRHGGRPAHAAVWTPVAQFVTEDQREHEVHRSAQQQAAGRELFRLLVTLTDRLPQDFVEELRARLTGGHEVEVAQAIVFAAVAGPVPLTERDIDLLIATLAGAGEDTTMARVIERCSFAKMRD